MQNFISTEYLKDPSSVKFLDRYVEFNPIHNELEDTATRLSIATIGQENPIFMLNGLCIDGRHRVKIAKDLGIMVKCIDVNPSLNEIMLIQLCNMNTMSGRDFTTAQKAIQALKLVTDFKMKVTQAAEIMKVPKKFVSLASSIRGFGRYDILDALLRGEDVLLEGMKYPSKSLELLCKFAKAEEEKGKVVIQSRFDFNPEGYIKTELGKAWFYSKKERYALNDDVDRELIIDLMELANFKFTLSTGNETSNNT